MSKVIYPYGQHLVNVTCSLTTAGLTAVLYAPGTSGLPTDEWTDLHGIHITTDDSTTETVTVTDNTLTLVYKINSGQSVHDSNPVPWRFGKGKTIYAQAGAVTAGKAIAILCRGISAKT